MQFGTLKEVITFAYGLLPMMLGFGCAFWYALKELEYINKEEALAYGFKKGESHPQNKRHFKLYSIKEVNVNESRCN